MNPNDVANAITQALVQGGSLWLIATIVAFLPVMWTMTLMLHLGRPYVLRTLRRCGLRLGADVWWMSYLLMRDGIMVITFAMSWIFFEPNLVANLSFPITGPLAALCLLGALAVKVTRKVDDDANAFRLATIILVLGATLYYAPMAFGIEAGSQVHLAGYIKAVTSSANPMLALNIMWASLAGAFLIMGYLFMRVLQNANRTMARKMAPTAVMPVRTPVPSA